MKNLKKMDNSFKYRISGILNRWFIDAGIIIIDEDEIFLNIVNTLTSMLKLKLIESILNL